MSNVQTNYFQFRAPEALLSAAKAKAEREGRTVSEVMRNALRREVQEAA